MLGFKKKKQKIVQVQNDGGKKKNSKNTKKKNSVKFDFILHLIIIDYNTKMSNEIAIQLIRLFYYHH